MVSERLRSVLSRAGWSATRTFTAAESIKHLQLCGYVVHNPAAKVLTEFGGLILGIEEIVDRKGEVVRLMIPATVSVIDDSGRFRLPPWESSERDIEPADRRFLRWKYGWNACYVGFLDKMYWCGPSGAALYSLDTGEAVLVDATWSNLYVHGTFVDLLDSLINGGHFSDRERILDEDEAANRELSRLRLFEGWQPIIHPTLWERIREVIMPGHPSKEADR